MNKGTYRKGLNQNFNIKEFGIAQTKNGEPYLSVVLTDSGKKREFYWNGHYKKGAWKDDKLVEDVKLAKPLNDQLKKDIKSIVAAVVGLPAVEMAISSNQEKGFEGFLKTMCGLMPDNYQSIAVDVFLEYQWKPRPGQEKTYLQVPKTSKHGSFITSATVGNWNTIKNDEGLYFINEKGEKHEFTRDSWYLTSNFFEPSGKISKETNTQDPPPAPATSPEPQLEYDDDLPF